MLMRRVTVGSSVGLHARPAAVFCAAVSKQPAPVTIEISWACVIFDISSLTRWLIGALEPTQGQAVETAEAGVAPDPTTRPAAVIASAKPVTRSDSARDRRPRRA